MKRTFKSWLAAAALAFVGLGSLLAASPANAYTWAPGYSHGIHTSCYGLIGSNYPESPGGTKFVYCGSTAPNSNIGLTKAVDALYNMPGSQAKIFLSNQNYKVVFSDTFTDYCMTKLTTPPADFTASCNDIYNGSIGLGGTTKWNSSGPAGVTTLVIGQMAMGGGNYFANMNTAHTVLHEAGHAYDLLKGASQSEPLSQKLFTGPPNPNDITFLGMLGADKSYMNWWAGWRWDYYASQTNYKPYFTESLSQNWAETFAEIFAMGAAPGAYDGADGYYWSFPQDLDGVAIRNNANIMQGMICAEVYVWTHMNNGTVTPFDYAAFGLGNRCQPSNELNHHIGG